MCYGDAGPASFREQASILYAPNSTEGTDFMRRVAQAAACPADGSRKASTSTSFYRYFRLPGAPPYCRCELK